MYFAWEKLLKFIVLCSTRLGVVKKVNLIDQLSGFAPVQKFAQHLRLSGI